MYAEPTAPHCLGVLRFSPMPMAVLQATGDALVYSPLKMDSRVLPVEMFKTKWS